MTTVRVQLMITCLCDLFFPEIGESTVRVLRRLGVEVEFPQSQTCCGQPAYSTGYLDDARAVARHQIEAFEQHDGGENLPVVTPSGSCAAMVRCHYPRLFAGDPAWSRRAKDFAGRVYELSEFIVNVLGIHRIEGQFRASAVYHRSCHMSRGLGVVEEPLQLLRGLKGLELVDLPHAGDCCGFGGTFAVKMPAISAAMADAKLAAIQESDPQILVGADAGCLIHLAGRLRRQGLDVESLHIAQVLDRATAAVASGGRMPV